MDILIPSALFLRVKEKNYAHFAHKDMSLGRDPLAVYLRLFSLAIDSGTVSLPQQELADDVRVSVRTLQNALRILVNVGYINISSTPGLPCVYSLLLSDHVLQQIRKHDLIDNPAWYARDKDTVCGKVHRLPSLPAGNDVSGKARDDANSESDFTSDPAAAYTACAGDAHPLRRTCVPLYKVYKNNKNNIPPSPPSVSCACANLPAAAPSNGRGGISIASEFSKLWDEYPIKKAYQRASIIFSDMRQAGALPPLTKLLEVVEAFKAGDDQWQRGYAPYLSTWLTERRWEDQLLHRGKETAEEQPAHQVPWIEPERPETKLPAETEAAVNALCADIVRQWPTAVNEKYVRGALGYLALSGRLPSLSALSAHVKNYLLEASPENLSMSNCLNTFEEQCHATSRNGESGVYGLQTGNRKAA
jgi:hypothetical protein